MTSGIVISLVLVRFSGLECSKLKFKKTYKVWLYVFATEMCLLIVTVVIMVLYFVIISRC
jgi:hypothetical protein